MIVFLSDTNPGSVFMILPNNGVITVNGSLDRETKDSYNLRIGVSDLARQIEVQTGVQLQRSDIQSISLHMACQMGHTDLILPYTGASRQDSAEAVP